MSASAPPVSAVETPVRAPAASALAVPPPAPSVATSSLRGEWVYCLVVTFKDYAEQFKLSDEDRLHEVSRFLLGEARVWHQDVQVASWADWKAQAKLCFAEHEPDAIHQLGLLKMVHLKSLRKFLNTFQKTANKALKQHLKTNSASDCKTTVENFHSLVSIRAFVNALTHSYSAMVQAAKPNLLEEAIALIRDKYDIWNKSEEIAQEVKAHLEDLNRRFDAMFMAQEQGRQPNPPPPAPFKETVTARITPVGHISKDCTVPCSICKEPSHSNFICEFNSISHDRKPQGLMMAEQNYEAKRALSSSATPQPLNKKSNLEYIVDPDGPSFPFTLILKHQVCSQGPSPGRKLTPPPMKRTDRKDAPSPFAFPPRPCDPDPPRKPPSSPSPPRAYVRDSKWNPCHPNRFVSLEIEDDFENEDHYPCLPDLDKYLSFEDNPHYNIVTVESVPESPRSDGKFPNLPSVTPSLEASPAGAAAWEHRATSQESKDKGPTAFGGHHCGHPGPLGPAMVSWVNSPGLGPIRSLNTGDGVGHGLLADPADLGEPISSDCSNKFNALSALYNVVWGSQPIIFQARQDANGPADAMAQRALYNPCDLAQPINSSSATCNSMHMASSEFSNLAGPITPDDVMDVDSPNVLINKCNSNEPIKPLNTMETDTPNVLSNNCDSDGPIRPGAAGAKFAHPDQAGCPTPGHPIRSHDAKKTNAPNVLSNYCNSDGPIRSGAANTNYIHTDQAVN
ncbi:hypothetical protein DSO57_1036805 [Entomophthora muscae]|uniref:Uncharacterized protein n=1 Tax=Entomophthora muscae TaxID=34485 RepID=A0ACC2SNC9_9FUNG|nr:hypothetical protein DSO57_1036805 [Entomophthora muscae]